MRNAEDIVPVAIKGSISVKFLTLIAQWLTCNEAPAEAVIVMRDDCKKMEEIINHQLAGFSKSQSTAIKAGYSIGWHQQHTCQLLLVKLDNQRIIFEASDGEDLLPGPFVLICYLPEKVTPKALSEKISLIRNELAAIKEQGGDKYRGEVKVFVSVKLEDVQDSNFAYGIALTAKGRMFPEKDF